MKKAGANFVGYSPLWMPALRREPPHRLDHAAPETVAGALELRQMFIAPDQFSAVGITVGGSGGKIGLALLKSGKLLAARRIKTRGGNERVFIDLPKAQPPGGYVWAVRAFSGEVVVWVRPAEACNRARLFADARPWPDVVADTWLRLPDGCVAGLLRDVGVPSPVPLGRGYLLDLARTGLRGSLGVGTQNNAFFTQFPDWFWRRWPDAAMRDGAGQRIVARGRGFQAPWPALEHAAVVAAASSHARDFVRLARHWPQIAYWVLGGESLYPTYFDRDRLADYSAPALRHWRAWCRRRFGRELPAPRRWTKSAATLHFLEFREQALAEVFQYHAAAVRAQDTSRPALVPVHGDIYGGHARRNLGMRPALWAAMGDGFETGQIAFADDRYRLNLRYFQTLAPFGLPIAAARLLQVRRDPSAQGGQRGFSPEGLRRMVYEAVGMGAWHIGLVQWAGKSWDGEWAIRGTPAEAEARRVFADLSRMAPELSSCYPLRPELAMYLADPTWLLDGWQGTWTDLHLQFARWHLPVAYIGDDQLIAGDARDYRCLLTMDNRIVAIRAAKALEDFVRTGGTVIVAGRFAQRDGQLRPLAPFPRGRHWSSAWRLAARDAHRELWRLGRGWLVRIIDPDYSRLPAVLRCELRSAGVSPPVSVRGLSADAVEAFALTDGLNPVAVLVNTAAAPAPVTVDFRDDLLTAEGYRWVDLRSGQQMPRGRRLPLTLPAHGVAVFQARAVIDRPEVVQEILRAHLASTRAASEGFDTPLARALRDRIMRHLGANRLHKALACAMQLSRQLPMRAQAQVRGELIEIAAELSAPPGVNASDIQLRVRLSPLQWKWWPMVSRGGGRFVLRLSRADLPRRYDPALGRYVPWTGPLRAFIQARAGGFEAEQVVDFHVPPRPAAK